MALRHAAKLFKVAIPALCGAGVIFTADENNAKVDDKLVKLDIKNFEKLSYDTMIKQSAVDSVNSASQAITIAYCAIETTSTEYRECIAKLMSLMEDTIIYQVSDAHEDMIIALRSEMNIKKNKLNQLISYMNYVERMAEAVTVLSQSAGMDNLAMSLCERMDDALKHKAQELRENKQLEGEYHKLQEKCVKES